MITLIHPSRQRPERAYQAFSKWIQMSSVYPDTRLSDRIQYILSIDDDDPDYEGYRGRFYGQNFIVNPNKNCIQAINAAAKLAEGDVIVVMSDDFEPFQNWDIAVEELVRKHGKDKVFKTWDGVQKWIVTLPIVGIERYKELGYIYFPDYLHMFCDTDMTHLAEITGKLVFANELHFHHSHYTTGESVKDQVNEKADSTWNQGEALYLERVKNCFGLDRSKYDPYTLLSPAAAGHLAWLKKKINQ